MTERWRKKLGDLDATRPSDRVYERAKSGPKHGGDDALEVPRASTRVVTGVLAFAVFALAFTVFALPVLHMRGNTSGEDVSSTLFPLWPSQDADEMRQLQEAADRGDAGWALDPAWLARKFGQEVMGWQDAWATRKFDPYCFTVPSGAASPSPVGCNDLPVGGASVPGNLPPDFPTASPSADVAGFEAFAVFPCSGCTLTRAPEWVELYQPVRQGEGGVWAVYVAQGGSLLSVLPGQVVHDGATIGGAFAAASDSTPTLGFGACGTSQGSSDIRITYGVGSESVQMPVTLDPSCQGDSPGYVWAATAPRTLTYPGGVLDPFNGSPGPALTSLTAVPVTFFGSAASRSSAMPTQTQTAEWTTYTDPLGWTVDVPPGWTTEVFPHAGAAFTGDGITVSITRGGPYGDDSSYPLDPKGFLRQGEGGLIGTFNGDGLPFGFVVVQGNTSLPAMTPERQATVDRMISSISFQSWAEGETRNGWTAVWDGTSKLPKTSPAWVDGNDSFWIVSDDGGRRLVFGPVEMCNGADRSVDEAAGTASITCADGAHGTWNSTGHPDPNNSAVYLLSLDSYPAVVSWDGHLLARLPRS